MDIKGLAAKFVERWKALNQTQKILAVLIAAVALATLITLVRLITATNYAPLFTGLDPKEAGKITEELKKQNIDYRVSDQGKTIEVPEESVYETRISLASSGALYSSGVGFELFDQSKFGVTEFEQQVGYQRALQEELRRTIVQIDAVEQARVHLVLPKRSLFLDEQTDSSASIALKLKPAAEISSENIKGIVELVAGSVEGLKPEKIHIIDTHGNSLSDGLKLGDKSADLTRTALEQSELRRNFEKELEQRIQNMLRQILGSGMAVAMVTADLDFDQQQYRAVTHEQGQLLSEVNITETGSGSGAGGAPGTDSDMPGQSIPGADGGGGSSFSRQETSSNYQVPSKEETVVKSPGGIKRLSVSVVLNGNYSEAERVQISNVVATAIGLDENRGDQIAVYGMSFDEKEKQEIENEMAKQLAAEEKRRQMYIYAGLSGFALLLLTVLGIYIIRQMRKRAERLAELARLEEEERKRALLEEEEEEVPDAPKVRTRTDEIRELAEENPDEIAEILKLWLKE